MITGGWSPPEQFAPLAAVHFPFFGFHSLANLCAKTCRPHAAKAPGKLDVNMTPVPKAEI
jgi:hypothetical protein